MIIEFLKQFDPSLISQESLKEASKQLWSIFLPHISYFTKEDKEIIQLAFEQMIHSHGQQRRKSGEYYVIHPVCATILLTFLKADVYTVCAGLLHDVPEDTETTLEDLSKVFDDQTIFLIQGVTKLSTIKYKGEDRYAENLRKMFVAMTKDIRVVLIKLADRSHNLSTLQFLRGDKRRRIALESLEIYAPIAQRLGITLLQNTIEELAFQYVYPDEYSDFSSDARLEVSKRVAQLDSILHQTKDILNKNKINYIDVYGRVKKYYSIFKKIHDKDKTIDQLHDLIAIRVVTKSIDEAYLVLSILQKIYKPIEKRFKDYIINPKENGYQSLHSGVTTKINDQETARFELQIRTKKMHEFAEYGVASHISYKSKNKKISEYINGSNLKWIRELVEIGNSTKDQKEYLLKVKLDLFKDRVFVFTPKNDVIDLPEGSTILDFAYRVHDDIGKTASIGILNDKPVKLGTKLKSGDVVKIITNKNQRPVKDWINQVVSKRAKNAIKSYLKKI